MAATVVRRWPTPTRNTVQLQFSSIDFNIRGTYFPWISEISYDMTLEPGEARGTSPIVMGYTLGELKANGSISIQRVMRERFFNLLEQGIPGFMDKWAPYQVQCQEVGWDTVETDEMTARVSGAGHDFSAGNGVLMTKFPLTLPFFSPNGHVPFQGIVV